MRPTFHSHTHAVRDALISPPSHVERVSDDLVIENRWQGKMANQTIVVHAGHLRADPSRGVLVLLSFPRDEDRRSGRYIFPPKPDGSLRIIGFTGSHLNVKSVSGAMYWFSLYAAKLNEANGSAVPVPA